MYLTGIKDLYTKQLVGYAISKRITADLVCCALNMAIKNKESSHGLTVYSDRGSQYCSYAYHKIIKQQHFRGSMSGKGNCFDNALIESFWGTLKNELVHHQNYKTRFTAINEVTQYIELYYNQKRIQKGLGYKSPRQVWFDYYRQAASLKPPKFNCMDFTAGVRENTTMKRQTYTPEIKEGAVRILVEASNDYPSTWSAIQAIAPKIGCTTETLRSWHKKHIDQTILANIQAQDQSARIKELERENIELKQASEIIRKPASFFAQVELGHSHK